MKKTRIKTYLTVPVFLGMLLATGQVDADEVAAATTASTNQTTSATSETVTATTEIVPSQGTYTFTEKTGVKSEPNQASPDLDFYQPGEQAHYDKTVENDDRLWISYNNNGGTRSYVAVRDLPDSQQATENQSQPAEAEAIPPAPSSPAVSTPTAPTTTSLPSSGTYTFTAKTGVKSEPKLSSPDRDFYSPGEKVNYDKTVEQDNHLWLSYTNFSGARSYVAVKSLTPAPVVSQPTPSSPAVSTPTAPTTTSLPSSGTYTFTAKTGVKSEPKLSSPDRDFYSPGEKVNYDKTVEQDNHLWLSYTNFSGGRSYVAVKSLTPAPVVSQPTPSSPAVSTPTAPTTTSLPSSGTYTFTAKTGVKSEPKLSSPDRDFYSPGEKVNYDKTVEQDNHLWLSYTNFSGGRSYVAVKSLTPAPVVSQPAPSSPAVSTPSTSPATSFPSSGTYTFTAKTGVKSEPKLSSPDRDFYSPGEKVNYDKTVEQDNHLWLSYTNFSGGRSYVAVKSLTPAPVVSQPAPSSSAVSTPSASPATSFPSSGTYTFTAKTGVKSEPKLSSPDRDFYSPGEKVNYDKTVEQDNHLWLSYTNFSGGRSYVAVKSLTPAPVVSQPAPSSPAVSTPSTSPATSFPSSGTYTFTAKTGVKSEPKLSSPDRDFYSPGEKVNYDKTVEQDNHLWLSYTNFSGGRSYVAVKSLTPAPVVSQPTPSSPAVSTPSTSPATSFPSSGTYTFTAKTGVKSEPKLSSPDRDFYSPGEKVIYDKTIEQDNHLWLSYTNFSGGRSYVAVKSLTPAPVVSQPTPSSPAVSTPTAPTTTSLPSSGTYTFTAKTGVKSEPKLSSPDRDFYSPGEKVIYDKTIEQDNHLWLSYTNFSGGRSYVAIKALSPVVEDKSDLKSEATKKYNAKAAVTDYQVNKPTFTVEVTGQADTKSISHVRVAVWSEDKGQDDLKWYEPKIENNQAQVTVDIANHSNTAGTYRVHVYTTYADQTTAGVDLGAYQINQPVGKGASASQGNYDVLTKTIYLDAGHGGSDPGAVYFGKTEKELNLAIQESLMTRLMKAGYEVVLTRSVDNFVDLIDRSKRANNSLADLFLSIHFNAAPNSEAKGIETYYYKYNAYYPPRINGDYHVNEERLNRSKFLAEAIHKETVANTGAYDNGVRRETFSVLRETTAPAVLVELGYMSNQAEMANIRQASYQEKLVDGIFNGIQAYYRRFT